MQGLEGVVLDYVVVVLKHSQIGCRYDVGRWSLDVERYPFSDLLTSTLSRASCMNRVVCCCII